jgi:DNA-binding transcriptional MerR regulator
LPLWHARPSHVDPVTGHRYYGAARLPRLPRLVAVKDLAFTLEQVGRLLDESIESAELRGILRMKAAELEQRLLHDARRSTNCADGSVP